MFFSHQTMRTKSVPKKHSRTSESDTKNLLAQDYLWASCSWFFCCSDFCQHQLHWLIMEVRNGEQKKKLEVKKGLQEKLTEGTGSWAKNIFLEYTFRWGLLMNSIWEIFEVVNESMIFISTTNLQNVFVECFKHKIIAILLVFQKRITV